MMKASYKELLDSFIENALTEDVGDGDHSSLACIPDTATGKATLIIKDTGIIAGIEVARFVFNKVNSSIHFEKKIEDGSRVQYGDQAFIVSGQAQAILKSERLVLNIMQRMSGIATQTRSCVEHISGLKTKIIDTRKTTPGMRFLEKEAVRIGGGENYRMGLFDMIMLKDNHIHFAGGIRTAIEKANKYLKQHSLNLKIVVEAHTLNDVGKILETGNINRIMLDNFNLEDTRTAIKMINGRYEVESSGGLTLKTLRDYAECGVDFISVGALTHQIKSLDLSMKAIY